MAVNKAMLINLLMNSAPMLLSAMQQNNFANTYDVPTDDVAGVSAMLDNGWDPNLLEDTYKNTGSLGKVSSQFFKSYDPEMIDFPSDIYQGPGFGYEFAGELSPAAVQNTKLKGLFGQLLSENKNRPAMTSALNMLNKNPKIGLK